MRILTTKAMDGEQLDAIAQRFYDLMTAPLVDRSERPAETKATKRHAPITVKTYEVDSC
jgi:hypothetical protein